MSDEGEKIVVKLGKKKPKIEDINLKDEPVAAPLPGTTFSVEDAKSANLAELKPAKDPKQDFDESTAEVGQTEPAQAEEDISVDEDKLPGVSIEEEESSDEENFAEGKENNEHLDQLEQNLAEPEDSDLESKPGPDPEQLTDTKPTKEAPKITEKKPKKSHKKLILAILAVLILIGGIAGFGAYRYILQPRMALANYMSKFTNEETRPESLSYDIATQTKGGNDRYTLNFSGSWDASSQAKSLLSLDLNGKFQGANNGYNINAETITELRDDQTKTFVNVHQPDFIETVFPGSLNKWLNLDTKTLAGAVASESCGTDSIQKLVQATEFNIAELAISNAERVGFGSQSVDGLKAEQFRGKIAGKDLASLVKSTTAQYNKVCKTNLSVSNTDLNGLSRININYDVWLGESIDKLAVVIDDPSGGDFNFSITTKNYNTKRNIALPAKSKPFDSVVSDLDENTFEDYLEQESTEITEESTATN